MKRCTMHVKKATVWKGPVAGNVSHTYQPGAGGQALIPRVNVSDKRFKINAVHDIFHLFIIEH